MTFLVWAIPVLASRRRRVREAVTPRQCVHIPAGPSWDCVECGQRFPCAAYKRLVWDANGGDQRKIATVMAGWMELAYHEILLSAAEYHSRFIVWIYRWPA